MTVDAGRRPDRLIRLLVACSLALTSAGAVLGQCNTMVVDGTAPTKVFSVTVMNLDTMCPTAVALMFLGGSNATCSLAGGVGMATHKASRATPAFCAFYYYPLVFTDSGCYSASPTTCRVDATDGLPVELLDFSVDTEPAPSRRGQPAAAPGDR